MKAWLMVVLLDVNWVVKSVNMRESWKAAMSGDHLVEKMAD